MSDKSVLLGGYTVKLVSSVINDFVAEPLPDGISYQELYVFSVHHSVSVMVYYALKKQNIPDEDILPFYEDYKKYTIREAKQELMADLLLEQTEQRGVNCMALKGYVVKRFYPVESMRYSVDVDIFFEPGKDSDICDIMTGNGFKFCGEEYGQLIFKRPPIFNFEMHKLIDEDKLEVSDYLNDVWGRAILCDGKKHTYKMTNEDMYIYLIRHFHKHYLERGAGIRFVIDICLTLKAIGESIDFEYVDGKLKQFCLLEFSRHMKNLSEIWFCNVQTDERYEIISRFIFSSGTFGTNFTGSVARAEGMTKGGHTGFFKRLHNYAKWFFLGTNEMKKRYPILNKAPFLLPFCWVHKGVHTLIFKPKAYKQQLDLVTKESKKLREIHRLSGL